MASSERVWLRRLGWGSFWLITVFEALGMALAGDHTTLGLELGHSARSRCDLVAGRNGVIRRNQRSAGVT
jgi:hypothetical protein